MNPRFALAATRVFDGHFTHENAAVLVEAGRIIKVLPRSALPTDIKLHEAGDALIAPGYVDLQVNGGGGVLFNNEPSVNGIETICRAHARFGTTALMVTLITDTPELKKTAIEAGARASEAALPGYLGLHLEGPHLSLARKGTHDPALIRPMNDQDLAFLEAEAGRFGRQMITIAPESVTTTQVARLVAAGYHVSLGHTDAPCAAVGAYVEAGASMVTHLFNAMSQLGNREPGLVGAALASPALHCGLIADGFHVDPVTMRIALAAKHGPARIFLVTDAMSTIGTEATGFDLNGRSVYREGGRLTLADGTLAGADIDMHSCVRFVHEELDVPLEESLRMASLYAADAIGAASKGRLTEGCDADFVVIAPDLSLTSTWIAGDCVHQADHQIGRMSA